MKHIKPCARCGAGISGSRLYCGPCTDEVRVERKRKQRERPEGVRYVGTKRGMLKVRQ